jgi:biotin carboxyl carrier protein/alkylated DNA nucleotide flippase Atl1
MSVVSRQSESPLSASVYRELDDALEACAVLARQRLAADEFYRQVAVLVRTTLAAEAVGAWVASGAAGHAAPRMRNVAVEGRLAAADAQSQRDDLAALLTELPGDQVSQHDHPWGQLIVVPVGRGNWLGEGWPADGPVAERWAQLALVVPGDLPPSTYRAMCEFGSELAAIAAEFQARHLLANHHGDVRQLVAVADLARQVAGDLQLESVAATIVNDGRAIVGCDRLTLLLAHNKRTRVLAISGSDAFDRHSRAVRDLQHMAERCLSWNQLIAFGHHDSELPPELAEPLANYADATEVQSLCVAPAVVEGASQPVALLVAEQFSATPLSSAAVQQLANAVAGPLQAAAVVSRIPFATWWPRLTQPSSQAKLAAAFVFAAVLITSLLVVQRPFRVRATGSLVPVAQSQVFAPADGVVDTLLIEHGDRVAAGDVLLVLRDPALDVAQSQLAGEQATLQSQLTALRTTRLGLAGDSRVERFRLSSEEAAIEQQLASLAKRGALLEAQRQALTVRSPTAGTIVTWQVADRLAGRPVERGESLLTVADTNGAWQLHVAVPDQRVGYVEQARAADELQVQYQLPGDDRPYQPATFVSLAERATETADALGNTHTTVKLVASLSDPSHDQLAELALRPGATVRTRLVCGERSLGYVLLNELVRKVADWWSL